MLAVVGFVVPEFYRFGYDIAPGLPCSEVPNGIAALTAIPSLGWAQMFFLIGAVDYYGFLGDFEVGKPELDGETLKKRETQELQSKCAQFGVSYPVVDASDIVILPKSFVFCRRPSCHACHPGAPPPQQPEPGVPWIRRT